MSELVYLYMHEYKADVYVKNDIMLDKEYWYVCMKTCIINMSRCILRFWYCHSLLLLTHFVHNNVIISYNMVCTATNISHTNVKFEISYWYFVRMILSYDVYDDDSSLGFLIHQVYYNNIE